MAATFLLNFIVAWWVTPAVAGRREAKTVLSGARKFNMTSTLQLLDASEVDGTIGEALGEEHPALKRKLEMAGLSGQPPSKRRKVEEADATGQSPLKRRRGPQRFHRGGAGRSRKPLEKVSVLTVSYNFGEACWKMKHREQFNEELKKLIEIADPRPVFIVLASQEVFAKNGTVLPLKEALKDTKTENYAWLAGTSIEGRTKVSCSPVRTAVEVAVYKPHFYRIKTVRAHRCVNKLNKARRRNVCEPHKAAHQRFAATVKQFKLTKGFVSVWVDIDGFKFRFIGVHLDTQIFENNLEEMRADILKNEKEFGPVFNVIAGDYNTRLTPQGARWLCDGERTKESFKDRLQTTLDVEGDWFQKHDVARYRRIKELLLTDAMKESMSVELVAPSQIDYKDRQGKDETMLMPTYKYPEKMQATEAEVATNPEKFFGIRGAKICKRNKKKKDVYKVALGVLDHIAVLYPTASYGADNFDKFSAMTEHIAGSDHAIVSFMFQATNRAKPAQGGDYSSGESDDEESPSPVSPGGSGGDSGDGWEFESESAVDEEWELSPAAVEGGGVFHDDTDDDDDSQEWECVNATILPARRGSAEFDE